MNFIPNSAFSYFGLKNFINNTFKPYFHSVGNILSNEYKDFKNAFTGQKEADLQQNFLNQQMAYNSAEAQKNRDFQLQMSNTAYQRMVEDLRKAGFNPALAVGGGGSSTPAGSLATSSLATAPSVTASSTARYNNYVTSAEKTFNNLMTNAFNLLNTSIRTMGQIGSSLINKFD